MLPLRLAFVDFPVAFAVIPKMQQAVCRIVALAAIGALQEPAPGAALLIVVRRDSECRPAAAGNEKHLEPIITGLGHY